ncbi:phage integrase SAM-like domain-containing protein [Flavobacterium sp. XS2P39]
MLNIYFYLKSGKFNWKGESPIFVRICYNQKSTTMTTGKSIAKERWEFTNKLRNILKLEKEKAIRNSLDTLQLNIEKKINEMAAVHPDVLLVQLKDTLNGKIQVQSETITILKILDLYIEYFRKKVEGKERSMASLQKYERSKELLLTFINKHYGQADMECILINNAFVYHLESFLKYDTNFKGKTGIKNNSVVKYMRMYKTAANYGVKMGVLLKNPYSIYDGKLTVKNAVYLATEELNTIEGKKISIKRLERVKDIFLFCCYTGYAPIDASNLTSNNLVTDCNGNLWIVTNRTKTAIRANVPVLPPVLKIINKYKNQQMGLIPKISNQKMNVYLKEIGVLCGIDKNLTWYVARHTFATTVTLGNGVKIENVSAMMGHTNIMQTQHYAKVLDANVMEDMFKLMKKYKNI